MSVQAIMALVFGGVRVDFTRLFLYVIMLF